MLRLYAATAKSLQLCPTLCDPIDGSPPGSLSLRFSRQEHWSGLSFPSPMHEKWKVKGNSLSCVQPSAIPWTAAFQAPPSMRFFRQEYWSGLPLPSLGLYIVCLFNLYAEYIREMPGWMKHKLESRLPGEIPITSDMQVTWPDPYGRKWRRAKEPLVESERVEWKRWFKA